MRSRIVAFALAGFWLAGLSPVFAGGSGLNTFMVVNTADSNSLALANYYSERRQVPPANILRIHWVGSAIQWSATDFTNVLFNPLLQALQDRGISNQIDVVVLSMGIPYRTHTASEGANSTTAMLYYGFKSDTRDLFTCPLATNSVNSYAGSEDIFRLNIPASTSGASFLTTMLTADSLDQVKRLVDQGVNSDGTFPTNTVILAKSSDPARNVRFYLFDEAIFNARVLGRSTLARTNSDSTAFTNLGGFQTGLANFSMASNAFVPGAIADSLTSYGGTILENSGQTTALEFIYAGAAGSFGTVVEPCNYLSKFPAPNNHFYQARGFSLAECYAMSVTNPYQGLTIGEPLAAPFAKTGAVNWLAPISNAVLAGTTNLSLQFTAADASRPIQRLDLYVDGRFLQTVTNFGPVSGNQIQVTINGFSRTYTVPGGASIATVASGLASSLNSIPFRNNAKVTSTAIGDRIQIESIDLANSGSTRTISVTNTQNTGASLATFAVLSLTNFLDTTAFGLRSYSVSGTVLPGAVFSCTVTKTNGTVVAVSVTNGVGTPSLADFTLSLLNAINANASLQSADGLVAEDFTVFGAPAFNLRARTVGWPAATISAAFAASGGVIVLPAGSNDLDEQLSDLRPRNHLYITAGVTNATVNFALVTTNFADGFHELTAVAVEGSHVQTQTRTTIPVWIQNHALTATLTASNADFSTAIEGNFTLKVNANQGNIATIQLFGPGGSFGVVSNAASAEFQLSAAAFGLGQLTFCAVVTDTNGNQYRTAHFVTRAVARETEIPLLITGPTPTQLLWPGVAGRLYDVLATDQLSNSYTPAVSVLASNSVQTIWTDPLLTNPPQRFYKVRVTP